MTNCSASNVAALPGPHTPTPTSYKMLRAAGSRQKKCSLHSFWSTALDPVEEGAMALFQQSILEVLAMAIHDQGLTCKRT